MNEPPVAPVTDMSALHIKGLYKTYADGFQALKGIDLTVSRGDFFALLGPNGAGKSTTIGVICTLVRKTAGSVKLFGLDIDRYANEAKRLMGIVPQEFNFGIFESIFDVVCSQAGYYGLAPSVAKQNTEKYMRLLGLWGFRHKQGRHLSGGMKRRLMIARAMVHEPRLLILDEPTAGVDIEMRRSMWGFLQKLNDEGITIILTTHYLEEAESLCRNIAIINQGKIIQNSSMATLLRLLDKEIFRLDLLDPIVEAPVIEGYQVALLSPRLLEIEINKGQDIASVFKILHEKNIYVSSLRNKHNRLEQLFIRLTGSAIFEEADETH